jgi:hypothetical protein
MVMRVQVVEGEYRVVLPPEAVEALKLTEGTAVRVLPIAEPSESRSVGVEEAMKVYFETLPDHAESYRELAR